MANDDHIRILKEGPVAWNIWRTKHPDIVPDLSWADLSNSSFDPDYRTREHIAFDLSRSNLSHSKFYNCHFTDVNFHDSDLSHSNFVGANFFNSNLIYVNFNRAALGGAKFLHCDLRRADLSNCTADYTDFVDSFLDEATFKDAMLEGTIFSGNNLSETQGLDLLRPGSHCVMGLETIFLSRGKIPEAFYLACGATDSLIAYIPSLIGAMEGIQFYSCFISYSSKDDAFARRLYSRMREERLRVWFAPEDLKGGQKTHEQIEEAIRMFDKLLVVLSENSLQSDWVMTEIRRARKRERETGKRKLFPIRLTDFEALRAWQCFDSDSGQDLAIEVREYHLPDFSNWKDHDAFEAAFARLLRDLKDEIDI